MTNFKALVPAALELREKTSAVMNALVDSVADQFGHLYGRWQDEREYEDFAEYEKVAASWLNDRDGVKFVKLTKRPFALHVALDIRPGEVFSVYASRGAIGWKREGVAAPVAATAKRMVVDAVAAAKPIAKPAPAADAAVVNVADFCAQHGMDARAARAKLRRLGYSAPYNAAQLAQLLK